MNYRDGKLDGSFLEYKPNSADTLFLGNYKHGKRDSEWKYWFRDSNKVDRIEMYKNDTLIETKYSARAFVHAR